MRSIRKKVLILFLAMIASFNIISAKTRTDDSIYFFAYQSVYQTVLNNKIDLSTVLAFDSEGNKIKVEVDDSQVNYQKYGHYEIIFRAFDDNHKEFIKKSILIVGKA